MASSVTTSSAGKAGTTITGTTSLCAPCSGDMAPFSLLTIAFSRILFPFWIVLLLCVVCWMRGATSPSVSEQEEWKGRCSICYEKMTPKNVNSSVQLNASEPFFFPASIPSVITASFIGSSCILSVLYAWIRRVWECSRKRRSEMIVFSIKSDFAYKIIPVRESKLCLGNGRREE